MRQSIQMANLTRILMLLALLIACTPRTLHTKPEPVPEPVTAVAPQPLPLEVLSLDEITADNIRWLYVMWTKTEWMGCLYGYIEHNMVVVEYMQLAKVLSANEHGGWFHCRWEPGVNLIGTTHPHRNEWCDFSEVDNMGRTPLFRIEIVICGNNRMAYRFDGGPVKVTDIIRTGGA